jgi:hypothetical protein
VANGEEARRRKRRLEACLIAAHHRQDWVPAIAACCRTITDLIESKCDRQRWVNVGAQEDAQRMGVPLARLARHASKQPPRECAWLGA